MKKLCILLFGILFCGSLSAQTITVTGRVTSSDDLEGIPGVSVAVRDSGSGTVTDGNGRYSIVVPSPQSVLRFNYLGYAAQEITVGSQRSIDVVMESSHEMLDEVVVVGYGEQRKASVVGAISNMKNENLKRAAPSNLTAAIGGRITGALVRLGDGNVGGGDNRYTAAELDNAQIFIRGKATTNTATPLILVDGVESSFSRINPEDVEQFSVLKDAAATAVYGVRGANGVILVTTKQGVVGRPKITINLQKRIHSPLKYPKPLGAYDYATLYNEANRNMGSAETYSQEALEHWRLGDDPLRYPDIDWYDEVVKDHFSEDQYNINISGGTESVRYYVSGEYNHAGGPFASAKALENDYKRYNLRSNFDFKVSKTTDLSVKLNGRLESRGDINYGESTGQRYYGSFWYGILSSSRIVAPIKNPNGTYAYGDGPNWNLRSILDEGGYRVRLSNSLDANLNLKQKLDFVLSGLSARIMYGSTFSSGSRKVIGPEQIPALWDYNTTTGAYTLRRAEAAKTYGIDHSNLPYARKTHWEFALNYDKRFADVHKVTALLLFTQTKSQSDYNLPVSHRGLAGRVTYDYDSKYLAEVNLGYNGSDQFDKDNRYALFPSLSLGWVLSEEKFMKENVKFINFFKIRGSYGTAGNDKIGSFRYLYRYNFAGTSARWTDYQNEIYNFGITPVQQMGMREGTLGNDNVTWEIAKKANVGIDATFWGHRINFTADVFHEKRDNILAVRADVPTQSGLTSSKLPAQNIREVTNKGYELELSYTDTFGDFGLNIGGNYTFARSNVDEMAETQMLYPWMMSVNHPVGQPFGYVWTGKFYDFDDLTNPNVPKPSGTVYPGDLMFEDLNNDGEITNYDRKGIGYTTIPEIIYGFNTSFSYKGFYVDLFWQGAAHVSSRYVNELRYEFYSKNALPFHLDRWVYDPERGLDTRETAKYPSLIIGASTWTRESSTFQLLNSSFLRLKTAEVGYDFSKTFSRKIGMQGLRIFLSGSNLLTFDKVGFIDPEYNPDSSGNRGNSYPQTKFYAVGISITL